MERGGCVYILTCKSNTVLYTGVTSDLVARMWEHINRIDPDSFAAKYRASKLVYFRNFSTIEEAIAEEKRLKGGSRKKKIALIIGMNPDWEDLYQTRVQLW